MSGLTTYHWIVVAVVFVGVLGLYFVPTIIAVSNRHPRRVPIIVLNTLAGVSVVGWIAALIWALMPPPSDAAARGLPVDLPADKPGKFRVSGVDRESGLDAVLYIDAESAPNARVKAELRGMIVTQVESAAEEVAKAKAEAEERSRIEREQREAALLERERHERDIRLAAERQRQEQIEADRRDGYLHCPQCAKRMKITGWEKAVKCPYCGQRVSTDRK